MTALRTLFPATRPSLLLDFANGKRLDPRINFTRNSSGTYFDRFGVLKTAAVNEPRFTHDPVTGESLGLMVEEQRTNLLTYSEQFDNAAWFKANVTITANAITAPDGTTTADKLVEDTATGEHLIEMTVSLSPAAGTYTHSLFVKAAENSLVYFRPVHVGADQGLTSGVFFDMTNGVFSSPSPAVVSTSAQDVGDGWWRISMTVTTTGTVTSNRFRIQLFRGGVFSYTGDGTSGIYIWGAQLEAGSFPTSYIKTEASQATRAADDCNILFGNNLLTYSEQFDNAAWFKASATVTANAITAPDGTMTADKLVMNTGASFGTVRQPFTSADNTIYTLTVFAKSAEWNSVRVAIVTKTSVITTAYANLNTGVILPSGGLATSYSLIELSDGWFRISISVDVLSGASSPICYIYPLDEGNLAVAGDGTSGIYIWGAQLEQSSAPNPYVRTVASPVTGKVWNDWFNAAEGSVYAECQTASITGTRGVWAIGDPALPFASGNMMYETYNPGLSGRRIIGVFSNGVSQVSSLGVGAPQADNTLSKACFSYKANDFAQTTNGLNVNIDVSGSVPSFLQGVSVGSLSRGWSGAANQLNGTIKKLSYYPVRLSNINLQSLTRNN